MVFLRNDVRYFFMLHCVCIYYIFYLSETCINPRSDFFGYKSKIETVSCNMPECGKLEDPMIVSDRGGLLQH